MDVATFIAEKDEHTGAIKQKKLDGSVLSKVHIANLNPEQI